jgi:hypothetical protein
LQLPDLSLVVTTNAWLMKEILARSHVTAEVRTTAGAVDNLKLLEDTKSGIQVGFSQGVSQTAGKRLICCRWEESTISPFGSFTV